MNAKMPISFAVPEIKPVNCLSTLSTIPEAISAEPSCSNLHDLSDEQNAPQQTWRIYENDQDNSKSTDALIEDVEVSDEIVNYTNNISFTVVTENQIKSNSNSIGSIRRSSQDITEKPLIVKSRSGSKPASKIYDPTSSESCLTDSQGYMDDFDESCALIANSENSSNKKRIHSTGDLITKRNSLGVNKVPQNHRFSAGDADKLEKGIKALPSTRSLRDS